MYFSISDLQNFYDSDIGNIVQGILQSHIDEFWEDLHGLRILGCGYALPYLTPWCDTAERVIAMTALKPRQCLPDNVIGHWCADSKNMGFISDEFSMPIENSSIDRILLVHYLENSDHIHETLQEIWRVLKANGRLLVIVPNRMGVWARADWSPFGHGHPFTASQLGAYLRDNMFVQERHKAALFVPPIPDSPIMMKSANLIERMAGNIFPFVAGVHMMEMSKQIYASIDKTGTGSAVLAKTKELLQGSGGVIPQNFSPKNEKC
ncbi:MAG: methyltransferase [Zetaproteobacteria bacterium]|nr:MAG: methyltransferase [Zetaproteobacteria bacterium]